MIVSEDESLIVSSLGWIDHGSLWVLEARSGKVSRMQISDADYLSLHPGEHNHFSVVHHYSRADQAQISVHSFSDPARVLARVRFAPSGHLFEGEPTVWRLVPKAYVAYLNLPSVSNYYLLLIKPTNLTAEVVRLEWFDDWYDKDYQAVISVVEVPGQNKLLFSVQRDSHPVLYDLERREAVARLSLAERFGNPTLRFRRLAQELWADDYDTLVCLSTKDWSIKNSLRLQGESGGVAQFIGEYTFNHDESLCAVARPFSGDVVAVDTQRFKVTHSCSLGAQPLAVALLTNGTVYARDWKSGRLLKGHLRKR